MLPKGFTVELIDDIVYWKNTTGAISENDAQKISDYVKMLVEEKNVRAIFIDNRKLYGVWTPEVDKIWIDLMNYLPEHVDKTVTLCQNHINKLQLNYLSTQAGTKESVQAFTEAERVEMESFLQFKLENFKALERH